MPPIIDKPERARQFARAIASDLAMYNEAKLVSGIQNDNLFEVMKDEIEEGKQHFRSRVTAEIAATNLFDNRLVYRVDRVTGTGRVWGEGEYDPAVFQGLNEQTKIAEVDDPSNYGTGRQWRLTLDYDF